MIPDGFTWPEWKEALRRHGLICTGSFGPMDGKVFRLGHMGTQAQPYLMEQALDAIAATLKNSRSRQNALGRAQPSPFFSVLPISHTHFGVRSATEHVGMKPLSPTKPFQRIR